MNRAVIFMPAARRDMIDAQDWYEREAPGLGGHFRAEVDLQVERIAANPLHFPAILADVRRVRLRRFPYRLIFSGPWQTRSMSSPVFIPARDPRRWQGRI